MPLTTITAWEALCDRLGLNPDNSIKGKAIIPQSERTTRISSLQKKKVSEVFDPNNVLPYYIL